MRAATGIDSRYSGISGVWLLADDGGSLQLSTPAAYGAQWDCAGAGDFAAHVMGFWAYLLERAIAWNFLAQAICSESLEFRARWVCYG